VVRWRARRPLIGWSVAPLWSVSCDDEWRRWTNHSAVWAWPSTHSGPVPRKAWRGKWACHLTTGWVWHWVSDINVGMTQCHVTQLLAEQRHCSLLKLSLLLPFLLLLPGALPRGGLGWTRPPHFFPEGVSGIESLWSVQISFRLYPQTLPPIWKGTPLPTPHLWYCPPHFVWPGDAPVFFFFFLLGIMVLWLNSLQLDNGSI